MLRAGVIGLGVGEQHIDGYNRHPDCEVVALCDTDEAKRAMAGDKYRNLTCTDSAEELLANPDIDVVSIASYDDAHAEQIIYALNQGKHVFAEKPLCLTSEEAKRIRAALNESDGLTLSSNLILRKCERFVRLRDEIRGGAFGDVFYLEGDYEYGRVHKITEGWRGQIDYYSVFLGGGLHMVDLIRWLSGDEVEEVSAYGSRKATADSAFRYDDLVATTMRLASGALAKVTSIYACARPHFHGLRVYGTNATYINELDHGVFYQGRDESQQPAHWTDPYPGYHKGDLIYSFLDAILGRGEAEISTEEVFKSLSVALAVDASAAAGEPVRVEYL